MNRQTQSAIIFDVDGVLVDSYQAHFESWQKLASETGVRFTRQDFEATFGRTSREILYEFWPHESRSEQAVNCMDERKESLYRAIVAADFPAMDGARDLLQHLHESGVPIALGSSGPRANIDLAIDHLHIGPHISCIISGSDVRRGKPDPEVFLLAALRLGVQPRDCVVVEDAPAGIMAARAADMRCVAMLSRGRKRADFAQQPPDLYVDCLRELNAQRLLTIERRTK